MNTVRKAEKISVSLVALLVILAALNTSLVADPGSKKAITWMPYDSAIVKAKQENKHVLIHFTTTWCGWCKKMVAETYTNPNVMNLVNSQFVTARVDGDSYGVLKLSDGDITEKGLTMQYGVRSYPTTFFSNPVAPRLQVLRDISIRRKCYMCSDSSAAITMKTLPSRIMFPCNKSSEPCDPMRSLNWE